MGGPRSLSRSPPPPRRARRSASPYDRTPPSRWTPQSRSPVDYRRRSRSPGGPAVPSSRRGTGHPDRSTVYVGGLPYDTTQQDVENFFSRYGRVTYVKLIYSHDTQEFRGFGFVSFEHQWAAEEAADLANGMDFLGSRIKCNVAKYSKPRLGPGGGPGPVPGPQRDYRCVKSRPEFLRQLILMTPDCAKLQVLTMFFRFEWRWMACCRVSRSMAWLGCKRIGHQINICNICKPPISLHALDNSCMA
jgi:hypothetical protein